MGSGNRGFVKMDGYGECGVRLSKGMLPQKHCTCQENVEANLEVIGGAGVRGGRDSSKPEGRNWESEISYQFAGA